MIHGCVESQPPVVRVQPNVTRKTDLMDAEWYMRSTVVDTPYTTDFTFVGEAGELERIVWEIQENFLVARRAYESVAGADPTGVNGTTDSQGAVIAAYAIDSHFDIRHEYNTVTGEELNVIVENTTDRPWFDREFIRVDWSQNLITDPNFMMLSRYFDGLEMEPVAWHVDVDDENDPNRPRFERVDPSDETSPLAYMEITNKMMVRPQETEIFGLRLPSCFIFQVFDGYPADCAANEITVRNSFLRVDTTRDYEPVAYSGDRMDRAGYFITERPGYDSSYGLVEPARYRFANRHNIWMQSHRRDADGELMRCTSDAQCDDGRGSVCDVDLGRASRSLDADGHIEGACTIAFRDREIRPVVYYLSENYPEELLPEMRELESNWNRAFVETVSSLRENECAAHGGSDCAAERDRGDHQQIMVVCPSPVAEGAPAACGEPGTIARIGDLRYSIISWVNDPHRSSPLGYGPAAADPETGEIISGTANLYGAGVETLAAFGTDILRLLNGDISESDVSSGAVLDAWIERQTAMREGRSDGHAVPMHPEDLEGLDGAMDFRWANTGDFDAFRGASGSPADMVERIQGAFQRISASGALENNGLEPQDLLEMVRRDPEIEALMLDRDRRAMAGVDPDLPLSSAERERISPLAGASLAQRTAMDRARAEMQSHAGIDWAEFADEGLLGLARSIQRAGASGVLTFGGVDYDIRGENGQPDYDKVREVLRHPIMSGLAMHEVGHTLGLRHNFSGSFDAINYAPRYWELRDDGNMRPRLWDPISEGEIDGRISEYAYSTVMDYGNNFLVTDANGIGHYDVAAIKLGYGDLVEVFDSVAQPDEMAWLGFIQSAGWPVPISLSAASGGAMSAYTYTDFPGMAGSRDALEQRSDVDFDALAPGGVIERSRIDFPSHDPDGRIVVPYRFCSDEQGDLNPGCYRYDSGADAFESVRSVQDSYWNYYIFNSFRRGRIGFSTSSTASRILDRYFRKLQRANQTYALYRTVFQDAFGDSPGFDEFFTAEHGMGAYTAAVGSSYEMLLRVVTTPEPGSYRTVIRADGRTVMMPGGSEITVNGFDGRALETTWDFDAGYYWFDQLERVGYYYDKTLAIEVLTDPTTYFLGRDTDADIRRYQLNFASSFGPSMTSFFGGLLSEQWANIAPRSVGQDLVFPNPLEVEMGDMPGTPISPNASFSIQLYAATLGMSFIPQTYDQQFLNRARIWLRGASEGIEIDPSRPVVEFTDPESGFTYVAASYMEDGVEHGVGAQMLLRAQALQDRLTTRDPRVEGELRSYIDNLNVVRRLTSALGAGAQPNL
ncbi:MAG: zinc-dependent metalloprotease [Sandaracinaceae bacterium]